MTATYSPARRKLGDTGPTIFPFALGCMGMSGMYGPADEAESIATIHEALERGVTLLDTGDFYGSGHNEMLIGRALKGGRRERALLSVKFGALRAPGGGWSGFDARPASVKNFLACSLVRLGVDYLDIYRPSRLDPTVPIEDTIGAIAEMVKAGYVRHIGLSEVGKTAAADGDHERRVHNIVGRDHPPALVHRAAVLHQGIKRHGMSASTPMPSVQRQRHAPSGFRWRADNESTLLRACR